jgi:hypothetical protein
MADTIEIVQGTATTIEIAGLQGPQGPQGATGSGLGTLTTQGDTLYQGVSAAQRLPIGTAGQILKVNSGGTAPEWGAAPASGVSSVNGETGAVTITAAAIDAAADNHVHSFSDINVNGVLISGAGNANANGPYLYSGDFGDRGAYHKDKDSLIYWDGGAWLINVNGDDRYSSTQDVSFPYQVTSWSVLPGTGTAPAPTSNARLSGQEFEEIVGQRVNPTLRGDAAGKNVGTGANDVAAGNHTHGNLTNAGAIGTTANLPLKTGTGGVIEAGAFGTAAGSFCAGDDARLSDARTPSSTLAHAASHAYNASDPLEAASLAATGADDGSILQADGTGLSIWVDGPTWASQNVAASNIGAAASGSITTSGLTQATARILGRTTASTGSVEEITIGSGLSLSAGELSATGSGVTGVTGTAPIVSSGGTTPAISISAATTSAAGSMSSADKTKLDGIASGAEVNVNADWNASSGDAQILNKPTLGTAAAAATTDFAAAAHNHAASAITSGTLDVARIPTGTTSTTVALGNHGHELTSLAATGATNGHVLTANGSGGVTFSAASGGVSGVDSTTADVFSVSGSNLVADDGGLIDSANPFVQWNDTSGKLVYANPLSRPSGAMHVGVAPTTTALGTRALCIQADRSLAADRVPTGTDSLAIGNSSQAQNNASTAVGFRARANNTYAVCIGGESLANGNASVAIGAVATASGAQSINISAYDAYSGNSSTATNSVGLNATADLRAMFATAAFRAVYWGGQTTNDTANVELNLDATATNRMVIAANTAVIADIFLIARRTDNTKFLSARRWVAIRRDGSNNTALIGAVQTIGTDQSEGSPTWTFTIDADDTASVESLRVRVTGAASETVNWRVCAIYRVVA